MIEDIDPNYIFIRNPNLIKIVMSSGRKIIFESHSNLLHDRIKFLDFILKKRILDYSKKENFLLLLSISENLNKYWLTKGLSPFKSLSLHDGFDENKYKNAYNSYEAKKKLGIYSDKKIVMYTGSLYHDRGINHILKLATELPE